MRFDRRLLRDEGGEGMFGHGVEQPPLFTEETVKRRGLHGRGRGHGACRQRRHASLADKLDGRVEYARAYILRLQIIIRFISHGT